MNDSAYHSLAAALDALPNGFPPAADGAEIRLLQKLFSPEEAALAAQLRPQPEPAAEIATRLGEDPIVLRKTLKAMVRRGLINIERTEQGLAYSLLPFVVGIYENQGGSIDAELARLFEDYYRQAFGQMLAIQPAVHRIIPVGESIHMDLQIQPYESAENILASAQAWGVVDCICRKQKALVGEPCPHPTGLCMILSQVPGAFDGSSVQALSLEQARQTLRQAADAGLVHSVSNNQQGITYICNCCTCACGILRGIAEMGIANAVARSSFICQVNESLCHACGLCFTRCQFSALTVEEVAHVDALRCVGCGLCALVCPEEALTLVLRPASEVIPPPLDEVEWGLQRLHARGLA
ncbi:MAG: 4Fe-4S binding protein [Anaerolineales bacterium]|nr:4Fe-4S binding protein [Anaerolineales bacterium]